MLLLPILALLTLCEGVIYHLNDTEYNRMPAIFSLDDFDKCIAEEDGVYCLAQFDLYADSENRLFNLIKEYSEATTKHYNYSKIDKGICVTKSCRKFINSNLHTTADLTSTLEACTNETTGKQYGISAKLNQLYYCNTHDEKTDIDYLDWTVAAVCVGIIVLNIIGSYCEVKRKNDGEENCSTVRQVMSCFSLPQNAKKLLIKPQCPKQFERLQGLNGVRFVTAAIVVYAHMMSLVVTFTDDPHNFEKIYDNKFHLMVFSGLMFVQMFFFLTGFLMTYTLQVKGEDREFTWIDVPKIMILRWWRLTPAYALSIAFAMTWLRHIGSGPLWKLVSVGPTAQCRRYWWTHLLYFNNYVKEDTLCSFPTWYLAADTQLFLLGIMVHVATKHRGRLPTLAVLLALGALIPAVMVWLYDLDGQALSKPEFLRELQDETFRTVHIQGHTNLSCFVVGMATGYLGYYLYKRGTDLSNYKICKFLCWCVIPGFVAIIVLSGCMFFSDNDRASIYLRVAHAASIRSLMGIVAAVWTLGSICKCNDLSRAVFEWHIWCVASKLAYCVYLVHIFFMHAIFSSRKQLIHASLSYVASIYFLVLGLSLLTAVPLYLMVEVPFSRAFRVIVEGTKINRKEISGKK